MVDRVFTGGEALMKKLRELSRNVEKGAALKAGFLEGTVYEGGTSVPMIAAIQEFGAPKRHIPPRPFFRPMIAKCSPGWGALLAEQLKRTSYDTRRSLGALGSLIEGQLQQSIRDVVDPPLAPSTVQRKGFDKPLIDTSVMIKSVRSEVTE